MNELFFNDITQSRYIDNLCYFSRSMKEHMLSSFMPGAFGRTDLQNIFDVLKDYINSLSYCIPYIPHEYFDHYFDQMCYEITMDICEKTASSSNNDLIMRSKIENYIKTYHSNLPLVTLEQKVSQKKSEILSDSKNPSSYKINYNKNYPVFYQNIVLPLDKNITSSLDDSDFVFYILSYFSTIFYQRKINTGIDIYNFHSFVSDYMLGHPDTGVINFKTEYSAFLFEQMFSAIQFEEGFHTLLNEKKFRIDFPNSYWHLYLYTRMYDTPYLSLSDYILKKYPDVVHHIYYADEKDFHKKLYYEIQILGAFWIPLCSLVIEDVLFCSAEGDLQLINDKCQNYIGTFLSQGDLKYSYYKRLQLANANIENSKYPFGEKSKSKNRICVLDKAPKTNTFEQRLNYAFSQCIYNHHLPAFILRPNLGSYSQDSFIHDIEFQYNTAKHNYEKYTLSTANEMVFSFLMEEE